MTAPFERLTVCIASQTLRGHCAGEDDRVYPISTATLGPGQHNGSWQTPLGKHRIRARIGAAAPRGAVFERRRATGEVWTQQLHESCPQRDWILTRILWLSGCEEGFNKRGDVDTLRRFIYIHGAPDTAVMGEAGSHGCIRMSNDDVMDLFERVGVGTPVDIVLDANA